MARFFKPDMLGDPWVEAGLLTREESARFHVHKHPDREAQGGTETVGVQRGERVGESFAAAGVGAGVGARGSAPALSHVPAPAPVEPPVASGGGAEARTPSTVVDPNEIALGDEEQDEAEEENAS